MTAYVAETLGAKYVEFPAADMGEALADAPPGAPILVLGPAGGDLSAALARLAAVHGAAEQLAAIALGQGQARHAAILDFETAMLLPQSSLTTIFGSSAGRCSAGAGGSERRQGMLGASV